MAASTLSWDRVRGIGSRLTTPLHPDDYLVLVNPLWTSRELRGRVEKVLRETDDAATLVIRPGWGWRYDHRPGQYVGIGVQVDGKFQWRSYSVSSPPQRSFQLGSGRTIAITVRAMPEGLLSAHLVNGLAPGTIVRLALPEGDFVLPDPPPARTLFLVGGSGITPVMAMLRTLDRRDTMPDVVMHYSSPTEERMIFRDELDDLQRDITGLKNKASTFGGGVPDPIKMARDEIHNALSYKPPSALAGDKAETAADAPSALAPPAPDSEAPLAQPDAEEPASSGPPLEDPKPVPPAQAKPDDETIPPGALS